MLVCDHVDFICKKWQMIYFSKQPLLRELLVWIIASICGIPQSKLSFWLIVTRDVLNFWTCWNYEIMMKQHTFVVSTQSDINMQLDHLLKSDFKVLLFLSLNSPDLAVRLATYQFLQLIKHSCLCGNKNHIGTGRIPAKKLRLLKDVLLKTDLFCVQCW